VNRLTAPISGVIQAFGQDDRRQLAGLINPVNLLNGVDRWLFDGGVFDVGDYGPVYGLVSLLVIGIGTVCTMWRYRKVKA
jgi:ABC-2 type transport system permease protein